MEIKTTSLTPAESKQLIDWLNHAHAPLFFKVLQSAAFKAEVNAANHLVNCTERADAAANADAKQAADARRVIALIREMQKKTSFETCTAIPS